MKSQGIIRIENPEYYRRKCIRSAISQTILQCLTFAAAIVTYHYLAMPQLIGEARQDGQAIGWKNAVEQTCPAAKARLGG